MPCQYTARLLCVCSHLADWRDTTESCQPNLSPLWPLVALTRAFAGRSVELCDLITAAPFFMSSLFCTVCFKRFLHQRYSDRGLLLLTSLISRLWVNATWVGWRKGVGYHLDEQGVRIGGSHLSLRTHKVAHPSLIFLMFTVLWTVKVK